MCIEIILTIISMLIVGFFRNIDERGHDNWDRFCGDTDGYRGITGIKYDEDGNYDFWGNVFDTNPWSINNWD